ncbi:MAG TPA: glycosyltransferase family 4 protein [Methanocella sp.]|uniref:glycosyltransferase family 4 protein n=1 Tax=Methanocella sp. TaxID=2052833 RepID=UPI002C425CCF|nr:glycosyltransferase family 4 protein [Methanocella sp.]HTY91927.1 glycosyltransferase family 4 protein [Methanocella sp.]
MKIGVVHWAFPPVVGGVESHLGYLYGELARMGHDVSILTAPHPQREDGSTGWCTVVSDELMDIDHLLKVPAGPGRWQEIYTMLEGYIRDYSPDVIHAHNLHYFFPDHAEALGILSKKYGIPIVLTIHNFWEDDLCRHLLRDIGWNMVVAVSYHLKRSCLFDAKLDPGLVEVQYHGIDLNKYRPVEGREAQRQKLGFAGRKVIFHPARMCEMKGTMHSIEAISRLKEKYPDILLVLSGNGDTVDFENERPAFISKVRQLIEELGISDNIQFVSIPAEEMPAYMNAADIVVYPTILPQGEAFGLAPVEAMACCRPVIVTRNGGLPESTAHGINGLIVDADPAVLTGELVRNIELLIERPGLRKYLGANGREVAIERFDACRMALRMEDLYNRLILARLVESGGTTEASREASVSMTKKKTLEH